MTLDTKAEKRLAEVHPDLQKVIRRAEEKAPGTFTITEGKRTAKRQLELLQAKATTTLRSRHLTGHAVDLAVLVAGKIRWDWPLYSELASVVKAAAKDVGVPIEWGGDWKTFKDGPHFQLPWADYP